jgi:hypothetical protein
LKKRDRKDNVNTFGMAHLTRCDSPHDAVPAIGQDRKATEDRGQRRDFRHVHNEIDLRRHIAHCDQPALRALIQRDGHSTRCFQKLFLQSRRKRVGFSKDRCSNTCRCQPVHQPCVPEVRDGGHVNKHLGNHDEHDGQKKKFAGQAAKTMPAETRIKFRVPAGPNPSASGVAVPFGVPSCFMTAPSNDHGKSPFSPIHLIQTCARYRFQNVTNHFSACQHSTKLLHGAPARLMLGTEQ